MDSILSAINEYRIILGAIVLTLVAVLLVRKYWQEVSFFVLRIRMNLPLIGKINRLAKQPGRDESGWFHAEKDLCGQFRPYFTDVDKGPKFYDNCKSYLRKVGELGRKKLGFFGWAAICIMVFIEAMGFSYVLAGFTIPGASESLQQQGAIGIALLISGLLVALTHTTGHELHKNVLIKKVRAWWAQSDTQAVMEPNNRVSLEDDSADDDDPAWRSILSRVDTNALVKPSYKITISTAIFVVLVAIGATYVRGQVLDAEILQTHDVPSTEAAADPYASGLPPELIESQTQTDSKVGSQLEDANRKGGWATFIVLAVIFIFLQILGVLIGFKTGFGGKESETAYDFSHKFNNRDEFEAYHERKRNFVSQIAQRNLTKLQAKMVDTLSKTATNKGLLKTLEEGNGRTFLAYARKDNRDKGTYDTESAVERRERDTKLAEAQSASSNETPESTQKVVSEDHGLSEDNIQHWMNKLGWDRQRTVDLLIKRQEKKQAEQKTEVSEEEALRMLEESDL